MRQSERQANQLKLGLEWTFLAEIERKEESSEAFEASSQAFRKNTKSAEISPIWNAIVNPENSAY